MKQGLEPGVSSRVSVHVTEDMTARLEGRSIHRLYSTFWMAYHFEVAARRVLEPFLAPEEEGIGYRVEIEHVNPSPVGSDLEVEATFVGWEGLDMVCRVEARRGEVVVGRGRQVQRILDRDRWEAHLKKLVTS